MTIWQADFYRRPVQDEAGNPLWELVVCDRTRTFNVSAWCPQAQANAAWLTQQLQQWIEESKTIPQQLQVFRPQSLSLLETACQPLSIPVEPTRRVAALKQLLQERAESYPTLSGYTDQPYEPVKLEQPPPLPLPEALWGEQWRFAAIASADLEPVFRGRPIPMMSMPDELLPNSLQLASTLPIPGVVIDGGRQSMRLARWLQQVNPVALNYIPGDPDGLILEAGLVDRWVLATFHNEEAIAAAQTFRQRQQDSKGLHFLLVQPDNSGMTYSGFWLLQPS